MEGDFISYLEKWIGENCLSLIRNDNVLYEIKFLEKKIFNRSEIGIIRDN
jgi:hypothetical protein